MVLSLREKDAAWTTDSSALSRSLHLVALTQNVMLSLEILGQTDFMAREEVKLKSFER